MASLPHVNLLGLPTDQHSSFLRGAAEAPQAIRSALNSAHGNQASERGLEIGADFAMKDWGDAPVLEGPDDDDIIRKAIGRMVSDGPFIALGGDHSITYPIMQAVTGRYPEVDILHFDAHPDLYDSLDGDRRSHASPFARIMEMGSVGRLVQVGIRTLNAHQRAQVMRFGVETIEMRYLSGWRLPQFVRPLYISIDLDAFDPAFAPGVSHHEPGGLSPRQVVDWLLELQAPVIGADVVELNPLRDSSGVTAVLAAKLVKELAALMVSATPA